MVKQAIRRLFVGVGWLFRPVLQLFSWWLPLRLADGRDAVLLPDSIAVAMVAFAVAWICPWMGWRWIGIFCLAMLFSPLFFLALLSVKEGKVTVVRLFLCLPYWIHRVPADAKFDLYEAWEDPAPTGVAFEASVYGADPLHLGTSVSAQALYAHVGALLARAGWQKTAFGYKRA